jgi:hypothetical protein
MTMQKNNRWLAFDQIGAVSNVFATKFLIPVSVMLKIGKRSVARISHQIILLIMPSVK